MNFDQKHIRNFCVVAHIDHGKSTLCDRILEKTGAVELRELQPQLLDDMDLERERGITVKLNAVNVTYKAKDGETYLFNLIDTPGHVDFTYEVSRSLGACEGALLVVDATQGVQAQTLANGYLAIDNGLKILPVVNKVDLPSADIERCQLELIDTLSIDPDDVIPVSAKTGVGVEELLEHIVKSLPAPSGDRTSPLQALIFDSKFDSYRGVIVLIRVFEGTIRVGDKIQFLSNGNVYQVTELGIRTPKEEKVDCLQAGEVGYLAASIKNIRDVQVGDTITLEGAQVEPRKGFRKTQPMVFAGLYPSDNKDFENLKAALEKLSLNDAALVYEPETSLALGSGFRCGFLGLLHMEVVQERLEDEFDLDIMCTAPSVVYEVTFTDGTSQFIQNPADFPKDRTKIKETKEPFADVNIMTPKDFVGNIMTLCQNRRGIYDNMVYIDETRVELKYKMPLSEIVFDFFDRLKSISQGYASLDYVPIGYEKSDVERMDILLNGEAVDALTTIVFKGTAYYRARAVVDKLKDVIPKQQFEIPVQAAFGNKIIARADIKSVRKDVLAKCYGGDISRKKKLLEKQKKGKKRMKEFGKVQVPQEAFIAILTVDDSAK
ncbi:MAG: translation elongation factor 4 [Candidatus Enterosoma sp.]|nr:translation elongation factor 4 [Bacilli bacterium]MCI6608149.1 translation elongation factor 4 [Bacilli bacterium]MDY3726248.1 translation elongation factor 4 [Candidatus Enterosoma sp.]MDY5970582.1 translation elongation factor 4 [Candidatus Enterosoma sp.]MDY6064199.1 translation elongation factor 4 [Candidatus Enterosoma sp.]